MPALTDLGLAPQGDTVAGSWVNATKGAETIQNVSDLVRLNAGVHVFVYVIQSSGANLHLLATGGNLPGDALGVPIGSSGPSVCG